MPLAGNFQRQDGISRPVGPQVVLAEQASPLNGSERFKAALFVVKTDGPTSRTLKHRAQKKVVTVIIGIPHHLWPSLGPGPELDDNPHRRVVPDDIQRDGLAGPLGQHFCLQLTGAFDEPPVHTDDDVPDLQI